MTTMYAHVRPDSLARVAPVPVLTYRTTTTNAGAVMVAFHTVTNRQPAPIGSGDEAAYEEGIREYVSRLWAEDWDSAEDAVYDSL